jgi:hypothetical protein
LSEQPDFEKGKRAVTHSKPPSGNQGPRKLGKPSAAEAAMHTPSPPSTS